MKLTWRVWLVGIIVACAGGGYSAASAAVDDQSTAATALIRRVLPQSAANFECQMIPAENGKDVFEIDQDAGKIVLRGNNGVSLAVAFDWYLRYQAHTSYDWQADKPLQLPEALPLPAAKERHLCLAKDRFFFNYCTYGYTFPYTDFAGWQRFIDWMAMNGINRPMLQCGQEATWYRVWQSYGLSDAQIRDYFSGPAHLPWHRMTNIDGWAGPLPMSYIDGQHDLQVKILASARSLGMTPILSGFSGHVPEALKSVQPKAAINRIPGGWAGFAPKYGTWFLAPADPLFKDIQVRFLKQQTAMYGTDHLYAVDPFNEIAPPSWDPKYLADVARSLYGGMIAGDPDAMWYQMSWTFGFEHQWLKPTPTGQTAFEAMTHAVPDGKLIYLDYNCEEAEMYPRTNRFAGAPFIWDYLGNFGGCTYMTAPLTRVADRLAVALKISNCIGVGSTLEGVSTNPDVYELTFELPWHDGGVVDVRQWNQQYAMRRGAMQDARVVAAWEILREKVLDKEPPKHVDRSSAVVDGPHIREEAGVAKTALAGDAPARSKELLDGLADAIDQLFTASAPSQATDAYQYDAVNLVRQYLSYDADNTRVRMLAAFLHHDSAAFHTQSQRMLALIADLNQLLGTRHEYLLGPWIRDARSWAHGPDEGTFYEQNARLIITSWGPPGGDLTDYARREWNGLLASYYLPRWKEFVSRLDASLASNTPFDEDAYEQWRKTFEDGWVHSNKEQFATAPVGDSVALAKQIFARYAEPR